jgi:DNA-binding transcriptional LysR family regulator
MFDCPALRAVATVVQTGSFERAARVLNVTPSAVSQRVKLLEERLGVVVIERGVPCTATERGEWLCRHMEHVGMLETELMANLPGLVGPSEPTPRVTLNIATNSDSLATWFLPAVAAFTRASDYLLKVAVDDEDHTVEWLQRGRVLAAVTSIAKPVQRHVDNRARDQLDQTPRLKMGSRHLRQIETPTDAEEARVDETLRRWEPVGRIGDAPAERPPYPLVLKAIFLVEGDRRRALKGFERDAGGEMALDIVRACGGVVAQRAQGELTQTASTTSTSPARSMSSPPSREVTPRRRRKG